MIIKNTKLFLLIGISQLLIIFSLDHKGFCKNKVLLLSPSSITKLTKTNFYNLGRNWYIHSLSNNYIENNILYLSIDGHVKSMLLSTAPGEFKNENKIVLSKQNNLIIEFDKTIAINLFINVKLTMYNGSELINYDFSIDFINKSIIFIPIPNNCKTIHQLTLEIECTKYNLGLKSIYIE